MLIDNFIGYFSPTRKLERVKARKTIKRIENPTTRKYDGATTGRRGEGWNTSGLSSNAEIASALPRLRDRARDLVRNNPHASRGINVIAHNVVGRGILAAIDDPSETNEEKSKQIWREWSETTSCDYDGRHNYAGLQLMVMKAVVESGEVLVRRRTVRRDKNKKTVPLKLQILESDFIASDIVTGQTAAGKNTIIQGIEFDERGKRVAYHLYEKHPGNLGVEEGTGKFNAFKSVRVPASEILHIYRADRPGQVRGVPWLAPAMLRLRDFDDYEQAQLMRQKLAASYMAFVKDIDTPDPDDADEIELLSKFEPGAIEFLPPGKDITLSSPPEVSENYADYARVMLQSVASALGVSYEALTGNLKDVNFSSARMGWLEYQRNIEVWRSTLMNISFNDPVFEWFRTSADLAGANFDLAKVTWIAPRREMIDPTKEVPALAEAVANNFKTLSEVIRENGKHPEDHFAELKKDKDILDKLGLTVETDKEEPAK